MYEKIVKTLKDAFMKSVYAVQIPNLVKHNIQYDVFTDTFKIYGNCYNLADKKLYMVGAGKAVFQMALEMEKIFESKLSYGIISVPKGTTKISQLSQNSVLKCYEGAENNLPDVRAQFTTLKIMNFVQSLDDSCVLIVLLSGGGSALLPAPISPITLKEKCDLIKRLGCAGANIIELNIVRKNISAVKGGKLLEMACPAKVITIMLSDIIGNHASFIASGPTFPNSDGPSKAMDIIGQYNLINTLPQSILQVLNKDIKKPLVNIPSDQYIIGSNTTAINAAKIEGSLLGYNTIILCDSVNGDVNLLSQEYCTLVSVLVSVMNKNIDEKTAVKKLQLLKHIPLHKNIIRRISSYDCQEQNKGILFIAGGEPTVSVTGSGKGGRSQELALRFSFDIHKESMKNSILNEFDIFILCGGTDGIDGPTDAAGAIGYNGLISDALNENLFPEQFIMNNDSYNFYQKFKNGDFHIKTGHTDTNVMDIHFILVVPKN